MTGPGRPTQAPGLPGTGSPRTVEAVRAGPRTRAVVTLTLSPSYTSASPTRACNQLAGEWSERTILATGVRNSTIVIIFDGLIRNDSSDDVRTAVEYKSCSVTAVWSAILGGIDILHSRLKLETTTKCDQGIKRDCHFRSRIEILTGLHSGAKNVSTFTHLGNSASS